MQTHSHRKDFSHLTRTAPAVYAAMAAFGSALDDHGLSKELLELVKLRASQVNSCAFCIQYHLNLLRPLGTPQTKLDLLAVWREVDVFDARERAAFAWTEVLSADLPKGVSAAERDAVREQFSEEEIVFLTAAIASINAWNRLNIGLNFTPPQPV